MALSKIQSGLLDTNSVDATALSSAAITSGDLPAGTVIQTVTARHVYADGNISTTSDGDVDTGFGLTITPTSTSSKILIMLSGGCQTTSVNGVNGVTALRRTISGGTTSNLGYVDAFSRSGTSWLPHSIQYYDDPSTTSAVTYDFYMRSRSSIGTYYFYYQLGGVSGTMDAMAMEIAQ